MPSEDIENLINLTYRLLWKKLGEQCLILNNHNLACMVSAGRNDAVALRDTLPTWVLIFSLEGAGLLPEKKVEYQEKEFLSVVRSFGLEPVRALSRVRAEDVAEVLSRPSDEVYWKLRIKGGCEDIFFLTTLDKTPEFISEMYRLAEIYQYRASDMGVYLQPTVQGTNCHCEFNISYDPQIQQEAEKVKSFVPEGSTATSRMGAFFSRPYGSWKDFAYASAPEVVEAYRKVKNIFDPNHIMNPGKLCF